MKIWYLSAYDQPEGLSSRTYDYSRELVKRGHQVTIFTNSYCHFTHVERLDSSEDSRIEIVNGITVVWIRTSHYKGNGFGRGMNMIDNARGIIKISKLIPDSPDVVIGPSVPPLTGWAAKQLGKRYKIPFIYEVRDVWPDGLVDIGGLKKNGFVYYIFRYLERMLYNNATRISSALGFLEDHVVASGADPKKIVFIPNGVNLAQFDNFQNYDGGDDNKLTVMYIGGYGLNHDVMTVIHAAKLLKQNSDNRFFFVLIGEGPMRRAYEEQATLYQLDNLVFRDAIPKVKIPEMQSTADILVAPVKNNNYFRFGMNLNKLCGYFASGRPVILAGSAPNNPVNKAGAGITIPPENPYEMCIALDKLARIGKSGRVKLGKNGIDYVQRELNINVLSERMENMLLSAIDEYRHKDFRNN